MPINAFAQAVVEITSFLVGRPVEPELRVELQHKFPADGAVFKNLAALCRQGVAEGWLADREANGIKYGRAIKPSPETHGFSVDVVEMDAISGPFHAHPNGEVDLILPLDPTATFDNAGEGWLVYGPDSRHAPTVRHGRAIILYLLPQGAIDFKAAA